MSPAGIDIESAREDFERDGWALVSGFLDDGDLARFREEAKRLWADQTHFGERGAVPNSATRNDRLDPVVDLSPPFADFAECTRLIELISGVLGGPVQLMKDKFIAKPGGAGGYAPHQDGAYWQGLGLDLDRILTATIFLDDANVENGAMECSSGQHHGLLTQAGIVADPDESQLGEFALVRARAGDMLLLHSLTPHRSGPNRTAGMRRALHLTFAVDPRPDLYSIYKQFQKKAPTDASRSQDPLS